MQALALVAAALALGPAPPIEEGHRRNDVYTTLLKEGLTLAGQRVPIPAPEFVDGQTADAEREALRTIAGTDRSLAEFLRNSVSAPFILKVHDLKASDGGTIRGASLWFAVHAGLDAIAPETEVKPGSRSKPVEAGNMEFSGRILDPRDLGSAGIAEPPPPEKDVRLWYAHLGGKLLDRIEVENTLRIVATRSPASWVIASRTDTRFDDDSANPNRWRPLGRQGAREQAGPYRRYGGGGSYVKISRLSVEPGALIVESHFAFSEPHEWFEGAPILRSKFSMVAQDQIRRLRRQLSAK